MRSNGSFTVLITDTAELPGFSEAEQHRFVWRLWKQVDGEDVLIARGGEHTRVLAVERAATALRRASWEV